jgi:hypothetical protein
MAKWKGPEAKIDLEWTQGAPFVTLGLGEAYTNRLAARMSTALARELHSALGIAIAETSQAGGDGT